MPRTSRRMVRRSRKTRSPRGRRALLLALALIAALAGWLAWNPLVEELRTLNAIHRVESHAPAIRAAASESGQDPNLLAGIMYVESRGKVGAVSPVGALGLFQLMLPTALERARILKLPEPSERQLLSDPLLNTRLAASYLRWLEKRYAGDVEQMLVAYNAGPGRLKRWIDEAGSYDAWRSEREQAGNSDVLAYARAVQHYRDEFAARGVIAPRFDVPAPPEDESSAPAPDVAPYGPVPPDDAPPDRHAGFGS